LTSRTSAARTVAAPTARGAASRARLVRAAREELIERDGQLEVDSVASRADASVGLIYRHFGNRAGLVGAVVDDFYDRLRTEALETNPVPGGTFAERERARAALFVAFHYADPLARIIAHNLHLDAEVATIEARHRDEMIGLAESVMALGRRRGEIPADRDAGFIAAMVIGGMREVLGVALSADRTPDQDETAQKLWVLIAGVMGVDP
jgi:AcrR family transcriptional regulator